MRISDVKAYPVWVGSRNQLVVKVETDEGVHGWGESGLSGRELAVMGALKHFREFLIGKDPMQRGRIWQELYRGQYFEGGRVLLASAHRHTGLHRRAHSRRDAGGVRGAAQTDGGAVCGRRGVQQ